MHKKTLLFGCLSAFLMANSAVVVAGNRPGAVSLTLADAYYHFADKRNLDNTGMPNIALAYNFDQKWAVEAAAGLINTNITPPAVPSKESVHGGLYTVNGLYRLQPFYNYFEPYLTAGVGAIGLDPNGSSSKWQANVNAGVGTQFFFDQSIAFRVEARDVYTLSGGKNDYMINAGISFLFGGCDSKPVVTQSYKG